MADYKCTTVGCYSYQSQDKNQQLMKLQSAINQLASAAVIPPIKVDGIIGKGTTQSALVILDYLGSIDENGVIGGSARSLENQISTPEQLTLGAQAVLDLFTLAIRQPPAAIAGQITAPQPLPAVQATPSITQLATTGANKPTTSTSALTQQKLANLKLRKVNLSTSLLDVIPPWATYVGGAALAIGALAIVVTTVKKRRSASTASTMPSSAKSSPAVAGWAFSRRYH